MPKTGTSGLVIVGNAPTPPAPPKPLPCSKPPWDGRACLLVDGHQEICSYPPSAAVKKSHTRAFSKLSVWGNLQSTDSAYRKALRRRREHEVVLKNSGGLFTDAEAEAALGALNALHVAKRLFDEARVTAGVALRDGLWSTLSACENEVKRAVRWTACGGREAIGVRHAGDEGGVVIGKCPVCGQPRRVRVRDLSRVSPPADAYALLGVRDPRANSSPEGSPGPHTTPDGARRDRRPPPRTRPS